MAAQRKVIYIIDGHSQIFRAYFAPAAFRNRSKGSGATYIFLRMLLKLLQRGKPTHVICTLDTDGKGFRSEIFPEYKAHREPMPEDLVEQIPVMRRVIEACGIPIVEAPGFEADDCIGTLAVQAAKAGFEVRIVSRDKDLKQLLSDSVFLYDVDDGSLFGPDELKADLGIEPRQIIDFLALMGDTSDNIPGAVGVGPKKAALLIQQFGSLAAVMERADEVPQPKMRENLIAFRPQAPMSYKLAAIVTDVPLGFDLERAVVKPLERERMLPVLREQGFRSIITDLGWDDGAAHAPPEMQESAPVEHKPAAPTASTGKTVTKRGKKVAGKSLFGDGTPASDAPPPAQQEHKTYPKAPAHVKYSLINTDAAFKAFVKELARHKRFAFDTETTSPDAMQAELVGMSFSWESGQAVYVAVRGPKGAQTCRLEEAIELVKPILEDPSYAKVGQNLKYDAVALKKYGVDLRGIAFDTMIAAYLSDNSRQQVSLDQLALHYLNHTGIPITALLGHDKKTQVTMDTVPLDAVRDYACEDADIALRVADVLAKELREQNVEKLAYEFEMPLIEVLAQMEFNGVAIDIPYLTALGDEFDKRMKTTEKRCYEAAGREFSINSPKQLSGILYDELGLAAGRKTAGGARSTAVDVLEELAAQHELPRLVLEYRHLSKLKSTYIDALRESADKHSRVHTTFHQAVATGRLSSNNPNVQNIPVRTEEGRKIRRAFVAGSSREKLIVADYSQIELRILAHLCGDPTLRKTFADGRDIHRAVAAEVNGVAEKDVDAAMRNHVKAIHFGILYGQSSFGLSHALGISKTDAQGFIDRYFKRFPKVKEFIELTHKEAIRDGYVTTILGRRRRIQGLNDRNRMEQAGALRQAFNTVVQGSAADLIKAAMLRIHVRIRDEKLPYKLLIQVHDELILEVPTKAAAKAADFLKAEMESALKLDVPITADVGVGNNWLEAKG